MQKIHAKQALLPSGWASDVAITVDHGRIVAIDRDPQGGQMAYDMVLPAVTNLHSHAFQRAMSGLTERRVADEGDSFWTWRSWMYQFLDQMSPDQLRAITAMAYVEMLEAGFAAVVEFHYVHNDVGGHPYADRAELSAQVIQAAQDTGLGLTLAPVFYRYPGCDRGALQGGQRRFGLDIDGYADLVQRVADLIGSAPADFQSAVAPHSLRAVDPHGLARVIELAGTRPIHMHIAEQQAEVAQVLAHYGARPVEWLLHHAPVDNRWCLIHCTQMTASETQNLAATGAIAGLCPVTEANLGDGIFNGVLFDQSGGRVGIGTDSNVSISVIDELRQLEYTQRLAHHQRAVYARGTVSSGRHLLEQAAQAGADAAARDSGALRPGHWADFCAVQLDNPVLLNRRGDRAIDSLIFGTEGAKYITDVWSAGRHVVKQGRHIHRDRIETAFKQVMSELE